MRAVLWDMDGTLIDSEPLWAQACFEMSAAMGRRLSEERQRDLHGVTWQDTLRICADWAGIELNERAWHHYHRWLFDRMHVLLATVRLEEDIAATLNSLKCWPEGSGSISPSELQEATRRLQRRWPTVILNLPYTVSPETIATGVNLATHVFLLADKHHTGHDWLYQPGHQLSELAQNQRVTVLTIQGKSKVDGRDVIHLPRTGQVMDAREPIDMPLDSESQTVFHRILRRIYKQNQP